MCFSRASVGRLSFILLNLFLSMLACPPGAGHYDEPESPGHERPPARRIDFDVNRRAESEIQGLRAKLNHLTDKLDDIEDLLRGKHSPARESRMDSFMLPKSRTAAEPVALSVSARGGAPHVYLP